MDGLSVKYYLTIERSGDKIVERKAYDDYGSAVAACYDYYRARSSKSILKFTTEVLNGQFARSYTELNRPEEIDSTDRIGQMRYSAAAKYTNIFDYDSSYSFIIESEVGIADYDEYDHDE